MLATMVNIDDGDHQEESIKADMWNIIYTYLLS